MAWTVGDKALLFRNRDLTWFEKSDGDISVGNRGVLVNNRDANYFLKETSVKTGDKGGLYNVDNTNYFRKMIKKGKKVYEVFDSAGWTSVTLDSNRFPHVAYQRVGEGVIHSWWDGNKWNNETVDTAGGQSVQMLIESNGNLRIFYRYTGSTLRDARYNGSSWSYTNHGPWENGTVGCHLSAKLDSNDYPHVLIMDGTDHSTHTGRLWYYFWNGSTWTLETVDNTPFWCELTMDTDDCPHVVYFKHIPATYPKSHWVKYGYRDEYDVWNISTIAGRSSWSNYLGYGGVSIGLDYNQTPHVAYYDQSGTKIVYCLKQNGTWWTETVEGNLGTYPVICYTQMAIALESNFKPCISYYDVTNQNLKYACKDGSWNIKVIDDDGMVGRFNDLVFDNGDYVISYWDQTNSKLRVYM